jgi:hypothetical protein
MENHGKAHGKSPLNLIKKKKQNMKSPFMSIKPPPILVPPSI